MRILPTRPEAVPPEYNAEQAAAIHSHRNCVVLAGPGSGKTKTLTAAMARSLRDIADPRGVACITYSNECALELEHRLATLGVERSHRAFIGTVHSFALTQIISPYARCTLPGIPTTLRIATLSESKECIEKAHAQAIGEHEDPHARWAFAQSKRRTTLNRLSNDWLKTTPQLTAFIESYEANLRLKGLIDYDDMPLLALRIIREHNWVRSAVKSKFPALFIDEYQDLGHALHELVNLLCFEGGIRLFAVGDVDQSIYGFNDAEPKLLGSLVDRPDVETIKLRTNYRCGTRIINASQGALGEERDYIAPAGAEAGIVNFHQVQGNIDTQAAFVTNKLIPSIQKTGVPLEAMAILYRDAWLGTHIAEAAQASRLPFIRSDKEALLPRNSTHARFIEACAHWVAGGWRKASPPFQRLLQQAVSLIYNHKPADQFQRNIELELIKFLKSESRGPSAHEWLLTLKRELFESWSIRSTVKSDDWTIVDKLIAKTAPDSQHADLTTAALGGYIDGPGQLNLSTFHSAKGREFNTVILFGVNFNILPHPKRDTTPKKKMEARRLFYVGVTRAQKRLHIVVEKDRHSPWVLELYNRIKSDS